MNTANYCREMGRNPIELLADWFRGSGRPESLMWGARQAIFTQSGRAAIRLAARLWKIGEADEVLVPAYNCGSEISPLAATGARIRMYRVDGGARIDASDLLGRISSCTRLVLITHYFGQPSDVSEVIAICRERGIKLLEDCALSLFSSATGQIGDAVVFSLRKSLPAPDGGVLLLRDPDAALCSHLKNPSVLATTRGALSLVKKWSKSWLRFQSPSPQEIGFRGLIGQGEFSLPDLPSSYYWLDDAVIRRASRFAVGVLRRTEPGDIVRERRKNYNHLRCSLAGTAHLGFLWGEKTLAEGVCPLGLPILVNDRRRWWYRLNAAGIPVSCWWEGYHRGLDWSEFPEARALKDHLILLPVHQGLTIRSIENVASVVRLIAKS